MNAAEHMANIGFKTGFERGLSTLVSRLEKQAAMSPALKGFMRRHKGIGGMAGGIGTLGAGVGAAQGAYYAGEGNRVSGALKGAAQGALSGAAAGAMMKVSDVGAKRLAKLKKVQGKRVVNASGRGYGEGFLDALPL